MLINCDNILTSGAMHLMGQRCGNGWLPSDKRNNGPRCFCIILVGDVIFPSKQGKGQC